MIPPKSMPLRSPDMPNRLKGVLALAALAIAVGALCGCGADPEDLSGLAADTAAAKIDDGDVLSLAGSLRTNEPNCTKNPVQRSGDSISYLQSPPLDWRQCNERDGRGRL